jgi:hypothetical protein
MLRAVPMVADAIGIKIVIRGGNYLRAIKDKMSTFADSSPVARRSRG